MEIRGGSMETTMARMAANMSTDQVQQQITTAVMAQMQDAQEVEAQALIRMMEQATFGIGTLVDKRA